MLPSSSHRQQPGERLAAVSFQMRLGPETGYDIAVQQEVS
jgi:hypothetical protein